jgi:signal transduction histidine kinase
MRYGDTVVLLVAGVYLLLAAAVIVRPAVGTTTYAHLDPALAFAGFAAGASLIAAGALARVLRRRRLGLLAIAAGACWFGTDWAGVVALAPGVRYLGAVAALMTFPVLVHVSMHIHRADSTVRARGVLALLYAATATLGLAWLAVYVPWQDPRCVALCGLDPLGPWGDYRVARVLATACQLVTVVAGVGLAAWAAVRYARSSVVARLRTGRTLLPTGLVGIVWATSAIAFIQPYSIVPPLGEVMARLFVARAVTLTLLGLGLGWALVDGRRTLMAVRRIADDLSPLPGGGSLRSALAAALGDPGPELVFPLPDGSGFVNAAGMLAADPSARAGIHTTPIRDGNVTVAVAVTGGSTPAVSLEDHLGAAVRLAAANERLLAAVRHEVLELRASRTRIVEAADAARHAIERDLHDGAQHRMLGVLHELSLAQSAALDRDDGLAVERLAEAIEAADLAIESLRHLARGIHPATLTEAGLLPALEALADDAAIPVEVDAPPDVRFPPEVETAAWRVVAQAVGAAARLGADGVAARVIPAPRHLELDLEIDGAPSVPDMTALEDRVGAAGGAVTVRRVSARVISLHVELPCA